MTFVAAKCPQCSGNLQIPDDRDIVKCMYCGVDIVVREAIKLVIGDIQAYTKLAEAAEDAGNHAEAVTYFNLILEQHPDDPMAWIGKGKATAWQSNLRVLRFEDFKVGYEKAFELTKEASQLNELRKRCVADGLEVARSIFSMSLAHTLEFISVPSAQFEHADRCREIIKFCDYLVTQNESTEAVKNFAADIASRCLKISNITDEEKKFFISAASQKENASKPDIEKNTSGSQPNTQPVLFTFLLFLATGFSCWFSIAYLLEKIPVLIIALLFLTSLGSLWVFLRRLLRIFKSREAKN